MDSDGDLEFEDGKIAAKVMEGVLQRGDQGYQEARQKIMDGLKAEAAYFPLAEQGMMASLMEAHDARMKRKDDKKDLVSDDHSVAPMVGAVLRNSESESKAPVAEKPNEDAGQFCNFWMLAAELGGMEKPNDEKRVDQDKPLVIDATMRSKRSAFKEAWAKDALVNRMAEQTPQEAWANEASAQARWAKAHGKAAVKANGYWSIAELRCDEKKKRVMAKAHKNTDPYKSYNDDQVDEPSSPP